MQLRTALGLLLALCVTAPPPRAAGGLLAAISPGLSRLQGSASLGRNRQVSGATILVQGVDSAGTIFVTASDRQGLFSVDGLPDGDYRVELRRDGLETVVKQDVQLRFPARPVVEVLMKPRAAGAEARRAASLEGGTEVRLEGRVDIRDGGTLSGAQVRLRRLDGSRDPVTVHSAEDGSFALPAVASGDWQLDARAAGFLPIRAVITLSEDTVLELSLVTQEAGYKPSAYELMPREQVVPPPEASR
jgi:Carboxypeptidase regulatory-like domain